MPSAAGTRPGATVITGLSAALVVWLAAAIVVAYLCGWFGFTLAPAVIAVSAFAVAAVAWISLPPDGRRR